MRVRSVGSFVIAVVRLVLLTFLILVAGAPNLTAEFRAFDQPGSGQQPEPQQGLKRSPLRLALPRRMYQCAGNVQVTVLVETNAIRLTMGDRVFNLNEVSGPPNGRYQAGAISWSVENDEGKLEETTDPSHPNVLAGGCRLESSFPAAHAQLATLTGTASFGRRPALPEDAVLVIELRNPASAAGGPGASAGQIRIPVNPGSSPAPFALQFSPSRADLTLSATITGGGKVLFELKRPILVSGDNPSPAPQQLKLFPVRSR